MCAGVTEGFSGVKLSRSIKMCGSFRVSTATAIIVIANPKISFTVKWGSNGILFVCCLILLGCLTLFGVQRMGELILLLQLRMVLRSVVRRIV